MREIVIGLMSNCGMIKEAASIFSFSTTEIHKESTEFHREKINDLELQFTNFAI